jgi:hypothetical protein
MERAKKFVGGMIKSAAADMIRGYITKRIRAIEVDDIIKAIESNDTNIIGRMNDKEKRLLIKLGSKFSKHFDLLNIKNVMLWMIEDVPFHAGIIYGHPKGLVWLDKILSQIKEYALQHSSSTSSLELESIEDKTIKS